MTKQACPWSSLASTILATPGTVLWSLGFGWNRTSMVSRLRVAFSGSWIRGRRTPSLRLPVSALTNTEFGRTMKPPPDCFKINLGSVSKPWKKESTTWDLFEDQFAGSYGEKGYSFFKKNGPSLASFSFIFGLFKQTIQILQQINVKKCPSSIWCQDSNSQPSDYKSPPLITRPVFPPKVTGFTY